MDAYIYQADIYCADCGEAIRREITAASHAPEDPDDERSYDSDQYPKGPFTDGGGESDCPEHCACGAECINAIELSDGWKVGAWLENPLTADGVNYVREALDRGGEVADLWSKWYSEDLEWAS